MPKDCVVVLLLGETEAEVSNLRRFLEKRGCHCSFATAATARDSLASFAIDLMISASPLEQADPLVLSLGGARCRIFYRFRVEDSCWWIPLSGGPRKCLGEPALRANEFAHGLEVAVREIASSQSA